MPPADDARPKGGLGMGDLANLVDGALIGDPAVRVADATGDSRQVEPGWLFLAIPGEHFDGHDFIDSALGNGAAGLCVSKAMSHQTMTFPVPTIVATDTRAAMAPLAAAIHLHPSSETEVVGITGTNGKTTVTFMLEAIARTAGRDCGLIGTVFTRLGERYFDNPHTTPEATDFQRLLRQMVDGGASMISCEVSSHALALDRVAETRFRVGAFTNLSQDHLDFHGGMANYFEAKARLMEMSEEKVIWVEDPDGARLAQRHPDALLVGWDHPVSARSVSTDPTGTSFRLLVPGANVSAHINLPGQFNLANALVAAGCAFSLGFTAEEIAAGLSSLASVPGRFEIVSGTNPVAVVVDYAHTPEGIERVIETARSLARGRVIALIGAGGDRDQGKRPFMGRAASAADLVIVTNDNPRSEDPLAIIEAVMSGVDHPAAMVIPDRSEAIATALGSAQPGDMVLILGKGHEKGQEIAGTVHPFSDQDTVRRMLEEPNGGGD